MGTHKNSTHQNSTAIAFLGTGSMNGAILAGVLASGADPATISASTKSQASADKLTAEHGVQALAQESQADVNAQLAAAADVVVLGVKPYGIPELARDIATALKPDTIVVSVAAAVSTAQIERELAAGQPVVRAMPNTPSQIGAGATSLSVGSSVSEEQLELVQQIFSTTGLVVEVQEALVDAVAAISGSGPAYVFFLAEALANAGKELGLEAQMASTLAQQTVYGAGLLLHGSEQDAAQLRKAVTSPKGTTEAAIAVFEQSGLAQIIQEGAQAAVERAEQMSTE